jgi:hypothetical protein
MNSFFSKHKKTISCVIVATTLALFTSSYTEKIQHELFAKVKAWVTLGQPSVYKHLNGIRHKFHNKNLEVNPVAVAQQVLALSEGELSRQSALKIFPDKYFNRDDGKVLEIAEFFIKHYQIEQVSGFDVLRLSYNFDYPFYGIKRPWYSGMAQGHGIIILLHAYKISGDFKYRSYAEKMYRVLALPKSEGGVKVRADKNSIMFEEYADPKQITRSSPMVLNGNIYAIDGLFWFWFETNSAEARELLISAIESLNYILPRFNTFFWSFYDLQGNFANAHYHSLHIKQILRVREYARVLGMPCGCVANYGKAYERWVLNESFPFFGYAERLLLNRNRMLFVIYISNLVFWFLCFYGFFKVVRFLRGSNKRSS